MSLCQMLVSALQEGCGHDEKKAKEIATNIVGWGAENGYAGCEYYWPMKARTLTAEKRDELIRLEFKGNNLREVCRKFDVSHTTVYKAVRNIKS